MISGFGTTPNLIPAVTRNSDTCLYTPPRFRKIKSLPYFETSEYFHVEHVNLATLEIQFLLFPE
jgi:hypothetical protein